MKLGHGHRALLAETERSGAPFGHTIHPDVFVDPVQLQDGEVWAAAGTRHDVFGIEPHELVEASDGLVVDLRCG